MFFFFFQAEDGIRDVAVTGVQTCALPISIRAGSTRATGVRAGSGRDRELATPPRTALRPAQAAAGPPRTSARPPVRRLSSPCSGALRAPPLASPRRRFERGGHEVISCAVQVSSF